MQQILSEYYLWIKAAHIIAVISWMAAMLYLPRLYVYHAAVARGSEMSEQFKVMEHRLLRYILNPAMIMAWVLGGLMLYAAPGLLQEGWIHVKLSCLVLMQITHAVYARCRRKFAKDENIKSAKFYRWINEVPTVLMIIIVIMAVVKPF